MTIGGTDRQKPAKPDLLDNHSKLAGKQAAIPSLHMVGKIRRAYLAICRCRDTVLSPYGITTDQYALMSIIRRLGEINQTDLGTAMFADRNTICSMVSRLEKHGILQRLASPTDGRVWLVQLTRKGQQLYEYLSRDWEPMRLRLAEMFSGEAGRQAILILERVTAEMGEARELLLHSSVDSEFAAKTKAVGTQRKLSGKIALKHSTRRNAKTTSVV
jgi:DNA-binding MarR family transcriptional regulator